MARWLMLAPLLVLSLSAHGEPKQAQVGPTAVPGPTPTPYIPPESEPTVLKHKRMKPDTKLCVIGDGGSGTPKQRMVAEALAKEECDHVFYVGDVIYEEGIKSPDDPLFKAHFYDVYKPVLEDDVPFHMIMGNHDYGGVPGAWLELAKRYEDQIIYPHKYYAESYQDICFIGMDTNLMPDKKQIAWVNKTLKSFKEKGCKLSFAYAHHPYVSSGQYGVGDAEVKQFLDATVMGKVDIYMSGHDHILSYELEEKGTQLFVSGGGGQGLYSVRPRNDKAFAKSVRGYIVFTIERVEKKFNALYEIVEIAKTGRQVIHSGKVEGTGIR